MVTYIWKDGLLKRVVIDKEQGRGMQMMGIYEYDVTKKKIKKRYNVFFVIDIGGDIVVHLNQRYSLHYKQYRGNHLHLYICHKCLKEVEMMVED